MTDTEWYTEMGSALKKRDHAAKMITKWQAIFADAEAAVEKLTVALQGLAVVAEQTNESISAEAGAEDGLGV